MARMWPRYCAGCCACACITAAARSSCAAPPPSPTPLSTWANWSLCTPSSAAHLLLALRRRQLLPPVPRRTISSTCAVAPIVTTLQWLAQTQMALHKESGKLHNSGLCIVATIFLICTNYVVVDSSLFGTHHCSNTLENKKITKIPPRLRRPIAQRGSRKRWLQLS